MVVLSSHDCTIRHVLIKLHFAENVRLSAGFVKKIKPLDLDKTVVIIKFFNKYFVGRHRSNDAAIQRKVEPRILEKMGRSLLG